MAAQQSASQYLSDNPFSKRYSHSFGQILARSLPNSVAPILANVVPYGDVFLSLYNLWGDVNSAYDSISKQNALANYERAKYDIELRIQQSANYLASHAILEEGRQYIGELQNAFLKSGISMRSGTGSEQLTRIEDSFRKRAMLARQGY